MSEEIEEKEEQEKLKTIAELIQKIKSINQLEKTKKEIIEQFKQKYAEKMPYVYQQEIIKKLNDDSITDIEKITEELQKLTYYDNNNIRETLYTLSQLADTIAAYVYDVLELDFYIMFNDHLIHFAEAEINNKDNNVIVKLGYMFNDELKDINKINKNELLIYIIKAISYIEDKIKGEDEEE